MHVHFPLPWQQLHLKTFFSSKFGKDNLKNNHNDQNTIYYNVKEALTFKLD